MASRAKSVLLLVELVELVLEVDDVVVLVLVEVEDVELLVPKLKNQDFLKICADGKSR